MAAQVPGAADTGDELIVWLGLLGGIVLIAATYGLWTFQPWGFWAALIINGASVAITIWTTTQGEKLTPTDIISAVVSALIVFYLLRPEVKERYI